MIQYSPAAGLIFHWARGSQYASHAVRNGLAKEGFEQSMPGAGNCYDNAPMESFWHKLNAFP